MGATFIEMKGFNTNLSNNQLVGFRLFANVLFNRGPTYHCPTQPTINSMELDSQIELVRFNNGIEGIYFVNGLISI